MKYIILGAGPAGLTFANKLKQAGEDSFIVLEKENSAGGLCRSVEVDGAPFDIGGGHFLDVKRANVNRFLFDFMPEDEWNIFDRNSKIQVNNIFINHPIEANIWQMKVDDQIEYLKSIAIAGCNLGKEMPRQFVDWIFWKLGDRIANDYMLPYNQKVFSKELDLLGTYWLEKLPNVSFEDTIRSCLEKKAFGTQPGHAKFYYPKTFGYGELWLRMASKIDNHIEYNKEITKLDANNMVVYTKDGGRYKGDIIVTTIPWLEFDEIVGLSNSLFKQIKQLKYSSIETVYYAENMDTDAHWIYYPNLDLAYHRILVRHNFCPNSKGYWTETNLERVSSVKNNDCFSYINKYAYPLNTVDKPEIINNVLEWGKEHNIYGLGRWGEHQHYNSDVTVELSLQLAEKFLNID